MDKRSGTVNILFVCTGNICRSPLAEGIFRKMSDESGMADLLRIDSAGTHAGHNNPPELMAQEIAAGQGIDISGLRSRRYLPGDTGSFDRILVADNLNLSYIRAISPLDQMSKVELLMKYSKKSRYPEIPDPYGFGIREYRLSYRLIREACEGLFTQIMSGM